VWVWLVTALCPSAPSFLPVVSVDRVDEFILSDWVEVVSELAFPLSRSLAWSLGSFWFERAELPPLSFSPAA
jgi:hypothetical protein